jgi:hypothetical protein
VAQQAGRTCAGCNVVLTTAASLAAASFRPERCSTTRRHSCTALSTTPVTLGCFNGNLFHFRIHWHTGTQAHRHTGTHGLQGLSGGHGVAPAPGTSPADVARTKMVARARAAPEHATSVSRENQMTRGRCSNASTQATKISSA